MTLLASTSRINILLRHTVSPTTRLAKLPGLLSQASIRCAKPNPEMARVMLFFFPTSYGYRRPSWAKPLFPLLFLDTNLDFGAGLGKKKKKKKDPRARVGLSSSLILLCRISRRLRDLLAVFYRFITCYLSTTITPPRPNLLDYTIHDPYLPHLIYPLYNVPTVPPYAQVIVFRPQ